MLMGMPYFTWKLADKAKRAPTECAVAVHLTVQSPPHCSKMVTAQGSWTAEISSQSAKLLSESFSAGLNKTGPISVFLGDRDARV